MSFVSFRKFISAFILLVAITGFSQGTLRWSFDQTNFVVSSSDIITMGATITSSLNTDYVITGGGRGFGGDLLNLYNWDLGENLFLRRVPANGTLHFSFGNLFPIGGYIEPGTYYANPADLGFGPGLDGIMSENTFQITVLAVPEPRSVSLGLLAMAVVGIFKLSRKVKSKPTS